MSIVEIGFPLSGAISVRMQDGWFRRSFPTEYITNEFLVDEDEANMSDKDKEDITRGLLKEEANKVLDHFTPSIMKGPPGGQPPQCLFCNNPSSMAGWQLNIGEYPNPKRGYFFHGVLCPGCDTHQEAVCARMHEVTETLMAAAPDDFDGTERVHASMFAGAEESD